MLESISANMAVFMSMIAVSIYLSTEHQKTTGCVSNMIMLNEYPALNFYQNLSKYLMV